MSITFTPSFVFVERVPVRRYVDIDLLMNIY